MNNRRHMEIKYKKTSQLSGAHNRQILIIAI